MNKTRPRQLSFRLSEKEYTDLREKIKQSGLSSQEYIFRAVTQASIINNSELKEIIPELKKQGAELNKQGNNLNQLVTKLNSKGYIDYNEELPQTQAALRKAQEELITIWQLLKQYLRAHR